MKAKQINTTSKNEHSFKEWYVKHKNNIYKYLIAGVFIFFLLGFIVLITPVRDKLDYFNNVYLESDAFNAAIIVFTSFMFLYPVSKQGYLWTKKITKWKKWNPTFWIAKEVLICIHLVLSSIFFMFASWHSIIELYSFGAVMSISEIFGLSLFISFILLYLTGVFIVYFYKFSRKLKLRYVHITIAFLFVLFLILHIALM